MTNVLVLYYSFVSEGAESVGGQSAIQGLTGAHSLGRHCAEIATKLQR